ncbi:unnamed protein product [Dicrocoelium dendriticum]|nr:unnamed protein product [Dicrocoelium dendriticum]
MDNSLILCQSALLNPSVLPASVNNSSNSVGKVLTPPCPIERAYSPILQREEFLQLNNYQLHSNTRSHSNWSSAADRLERSNCSLHTECLKNCNSSEPGVIRKPRRLRKRRLGSRSKSLLPDRQFSLPQSPLLGSDHQRPNIFDNCPIYPDFADSGLTYTEDDSGRISFKPHQELSNSYCRSCKTIRLHFKNVCSKCKEARNFSPVTSCPPVLKSTDLTCIPTVKTDFLQTAAIGLSEFPQSSSEEETQLNGEQQSGNPGPEAKLVGDLPLGHHDAEIASLKIPRISTMNSPEELLQRIARLEDHVDSLYSLSNSGSQSGESTKQNGSRAYSRPKLPAVLMKRQASAPQPGSINAVRTQNDSNQLCSNGFHEIKPEKLRANSHKLMAQAELRCKNKNQCDEISKDTQSVRYSQSSNEDREVARFLSGAEHTPNINHRLLTMLQRRNGIQTSAVIGENDASKKPGLRVTRRNNCTTTPARTRSLQPTSRVENGVDRVRRDPSLASKRAESRTRNSGSSSDSQKLSAPEKAASISGKKDNVVATNTAKMNALLGLQRRKAYDPHSSLRNANNLSKDTPRSATSTGKVNAPQRPPSQLSRTTEAARRSGRRPSNTFNLTAPVQTADCLAALQSIATEKEYPSHCSVVPRLLLNPANDSWTHSPTPRNSSFVNATTTEGKQRRQVRASSVNAADIPRTTNGRGAMTNRDNEQASAKFRGKSQTGMHSDRKVPRSVSYKQSLNRQSASQTERRENESVDQSKMRNPQVITKAKTKWVEIDLDQPYPDVAVESIRFKSEKLANFIVRLRRRIERDCAEQGTCSPGDDVFGDEAIGAVVAGQPTGMHPVVTACLKNLRILEFNAQQIFSLLYPTEIDLWEPARTCLAGNVGDEQAYNEAQSRLTDRLSHCIKQIEERTLSQNPANDVLSPHLVSVSVLRENTTSNGVTPTEDGDVI